MAEPLFLADDAATLELGTRLAGLLRPGDLVLLEGDLGAGKTALARAIIRARSGDTGLEVPSPTFALVQPYETAAGPVNHADLYRLASAFDLEELGLFDRLEAIVLVEWSERAPALAGRATVTVTLAVPKGGEGRVVTVDFADGRGL